MNPAGGRRFTGARAEAPHRESKYESEDAGIGELCNDLLPGQGRHHGEREQRHGGADLG
jgi:hypothetical protein